MAKSMSEHVFRIVGLEIALVQLIVDINLVAPETRLKFVEKDLKMFCHEVINSLWNVYLLLLNAEKISMKYRTFSLDSALSPRSDRSAINSSKISDFVDLVTLSTL